MAKTILEEALEDAKTLKRTAIENAKNVLVEAISPKIKEFVESQLGECMPGSNMEGSPSGQQEPQTLVLKLMPQLGGMHSEEEAAMPPMAPQEGEDDGDDMDLMKKLGVLGGADDEDSEESDSEEDSDEDDSEDEESDDSEEEDDDSEDEPSKDGKEDMDETFMSENPNEAFTEAKDEDKEDKKVDEVVEITNEDLKAALSEVLGSLRVQEAKVKKGFGDVESATIKASGGPGGMGIADAKSGEHQWKDETPPAAKDWTVKEAKQAIAAFRKENASLKNENAQYKEAYTMLRSKLQEVNLFNSKLLYTQKLLNLSELNNKQRLGVIEAFDRAQSMREVELVYRSLSESFKIAGVLSESKQAKASNAKASRLTAPGSTVLREAMVKEERQVASGGDFASRMQELAGIVD